MLKLFCVIPFLLIASSCFCEFSDHIKKAEGKCEYYSMKNIDFIYMINLDKRPQKFENSKMQLENYGIHPYRFSAVNGCELSLEAINDVGLKYQPGMEPLLSTTFYEINGEIIQSHEWMTEYGKTYFSHRTPLGAIGCYLSHLSVLQDAYISGYETIWVMEDDIEVLGDPRILSKIIDQLDLLVGHGKWDVLFTDRDFRIGVGVYAPVFGAAKRPDMDCSVEERFSDKYVKSYPISYNLRKIAGRFGLTSMIIRKSGIIKMLQFAMNRHIYLPIDLENYLPKGIIRYSLNYDLVTNLLNAPSDIDHTSL